MKRVVGILFLVFALIAVLASCGLDVPDPEIEKGEFSFSVTYEFEGKVETISGVYVCEYDGASWAIDGGANREWIGYIKDDTVEDMIKLGTVEGDNEVHLHLNFCPEYFMDDFVEGYHEVPKPEISVTLNDGEGLSFMNDPQEVEEYCGAKIVSYEYEEPIENSFGDEE